MGKELIIILIMKVGNMLQFFLLKILLLAFVFRNFVFFF